MRGYFSFDRFITNGFVKVFYFLGFVFISVGGIALALWAGMRLQNASISKEAGWRFVAIGIGALIIGNLVWRVFCEIWVVLFSIHARLAGIVRALHTGEAQMVTHSSEREIESSIDPQAERIMEPAVPLEKNYDSRRQSSVLGLT
jgi:hypothetical protein